MPMEKGATVVIETSGGENFQLHESDDATYTAAGLSVNKTSTYKLHITTLDGNEYRSDPVRIYSTPPIDSIYFTIAGSGVDIEFRVSSHDEDPDATGYYAYDGIETFEYHASTYSGYKLINHRAVERTPAEQVYTCWRDLVVGPSVASTHHLSKNIVSGQKVQKLFKDDIRISVRYSLLLRQRAISEAEYLYLNQLIKSTEQLGTLYAATPGVVPSNVHPITNPKEYVLGYFTGQEQKELRYFLERKDLPKSMAIFPRSSNCQQEQTCPTTIGPDYPNRCLKLEDLGNGAVITSVHNLPSGDPLYYNYVSLDCGDCRSRGGNTTKPPFW